MESHLIGVQQPDMIWNLDLAHSLEQMETIRDLKIRSWDIILVKNLILQYSSQIAIRVLILQESRRISTLY